MASTRDKAGRPVVVVTGMGVVTPLGAGKDENWTKLTIGQSGIGTKGAFPGPLFLAVAPVEFEWPHREAFAAAAGANNSIDYDALLRAAASGRFRALHERC